MHVVVAVEQNALPLFDGSRQTWSCTIHIFEQVGIVKVRRSRREIPARRLRFAQSPGAQYARGRSANPQRRRQPHRGPASERCFASERRARIRFRENPLHATTQFFIVYVIPPGPNSSIIVLPPESRCNL